MDGDAYRFTMHKVDRDISTDRQRNEVRGMRTGGYDLILLKGSPLVAGTNTIRATATTSNGGPNVDSVLVEITPSS
jgi:hypothetical protein